MFNSCWQLKYLDLQSFNQSKVTTMEKKFYQFQSLTDIYFSEKIETKKVIKFTSMFNSWKNLKYINLHTFDTNIAEDMSYMFFNCFNLFSMDLSSFEPYNVKSFTNIFDNLAGLTNIDFNLDVSLATDLSSLFYNCIELKNVNNNEVYKYGIYVLKLP